MVHRLAVPGDASRLYELRRRSILTLTPPIMSIEEARSWAARLTPSGMQGKLRELEIWVAEQGGSVVGWGAIRGERLEGLYTDPEFARTGVGARLLGMLEDVMYERGVVEVRAEASSNARDFYLRRGYTLTASQAAQGAWPMAKQIR